MMHNWQEHLTRTSRTFALAIPLLPSPLERQVTLAYLLFRVADTLEDAHSWSPQKRAQALDKLALLLDTPEDLSLAANLANQWSAPDSKLSKHAGYVALVSRLPDLLNDIKTLGPVPFRTIVSRVQDTTRRMAGFIRDASTNTGIVRLHSIGDLKDYCYAVAGIVGVLLTDLFLEEIPQLAPARSTLRATDKAYGEGLQLVNILKDSADDAKEGRVFIPAHSQRAELFALARADLRDAERYIGAMVEARAPAGLVQFVRLPAALALATLDKVERLGPRAKLTRKEVTQLLSDVSQG